MNRDTAKLSLTPYQRRLFAFLSVATFFEGYDFMALAQVLPALRQDLGINRAEGGLLFTVVNVGTVIAYLLIRKADTWGRRRVLQVTILGYTLFSGLSGFAANIYVFGLLQLCARVFLIAEYATSMVIAAEEFPAERRGMVIGVIQAFASLGAILCAGVVPALLKTEYGWRSVYWVGVLPLLILALLRRDLRETERFVARVAQRGAAPVAGFFDILKSPYRDRVLKLGAVWFLAYLTMQNAVSFWKDYAVTELGLGEKMAAKAMVIGAIGSLPLLFLTGKLLDKVGRRHGAAIILIVGAISVFGSYTLEHFAELTFALTLTVWAASSFLAALVAFNTELFPTEWRGDALAWSNNLIGRMGYVVSPSIIGAIAEHVGWGAVMRPTSVFALLTVVCIYAWLPETVGRPLEETSAL